MNRPLAHRLAFPLAAAVLLAGCASTGSAVTAAGPSGAPIVTPGAVAGSGAPTASATGTPAPSATACPPSGVRLEFGALDAAMGLRALAVNLLNCGREPYRVNGYPAVHALNEQRSPLDVRVLNGVTEIAGPIPDWTGPPRPVVLKPGERATAVVVWRNTYDDISQPPVNAAYLEVAPAAGRPTQVLAVQDGIDLGSTGRLGVSPWRLTPTPATPLPSTPAANAPTSEHTRGPLP